MDPKEKELREKIKPIMESMVYQLVCERPDNPALFMINWLQKTGNYTSNGKKKIIVGLTKDEKNELEKLRQEIKKYREMDSENTNEDSKSHKSHDSDEEDADKSEIDLTKNNNRLSLKRTGVSSEVYGKFNAKGNFKPRVIQKTEDQNQRIKARILQSFLFCNLDQDALQIVINAMEEKKYQPEDSVIEQGENGDCLFVIETGELNCYKRFGKDQEAKFLKTYGPGDSFGELALLYNAPRAATVKAKTACTLFLLDRETFNHIVKEAAQQKRNKYEAFLKSVEILSTIDPYELMQISDALRTATFSKGEYVIKQGEMGDVFYIIEEGEAAATITKEPGKPPQTVKTYGKGDYFGELALVKGEPRAANVVATSNLKLISLDRDSFKRLLGPLEEILKRNSDKYVKFVK